MATLVHLRTGLTREALGVLYEVGSSTIGRAIREVRPLLADRGFAVPDRPGIRLRTLEDVFAYAAAEGVTLRIDGMETQVRRPHAGPRPAGLRLRQAQAEHRRSPSPLWSPTVPPSGPPGTNPAPSWYTSAPRPAEPPASQTRRRTRLEINRGSAR
ncbi:transposase family protein [Streptomyces rishiriensis]|uniref:helix-turn-helix domain-containing protein n=1 Tax=Streptomyces rishiriensis TaxID=68264 RepID=UPI001C3FD22B|nr:transposase family protein [Streptomyces rishiriensis]